MLRAAFFLAILLVQIGSAGAQDADAQMVGEEIGFILRPSQDPLEEDIWTVPEVPTGSIGAPIGPPLLGPTGGERLGPALAGPPPPVEVTAAPANVRRWESAPDPYEALGVKLGPFVIRPAIEIGVSATDNVVGGGDREAAVGLLVAPELDIRSEGDRYQLGADLRGEAILYGDDEYDEREADARISGIYELTSRTTLEAGIGYRFGLDRYTDPDTPAAAVERPGVHSFDATLGATQRFGRLGVGLSGSVERDVHDDVALAGGGTAERDELDNTSYGLQLRTSYEASGALTPFVDVAVGQRDYDQEAETDYERSSVWGELRGGLIFDLGPKLRGELAIGYRREELDDDRLDDLDAVTAAAAIMWSPRRLTEIRLDLSTDTRPTSFSDAAGSIAYTGTLTATRRITQRFSLEAGLGIDHERYVGADRRETEMSAFAGASYTLNRWAAVRARYTYERLDSSGAGAQSDENIVSVRMRLQY